MDEPVQRWKHDQGQKRGGDDPPDHDRREWTLDLAASADVECHRDKAETRHQRGHQDGAKALKGALSDRE